MTIEELKTPEFLWFGAGFALAAILSVSLDAARYVSVSVAFGLLSFGSGVTLMQFLALRRQEKRQETEEGHWVEEYGKLVEEREEWEEQKKIWELRKLQWESEKEVAVRKEALRLLEEEAARRGGEQIDRETGGQDKK